MTNWYFLLKKNASGVDDIRMTLANKHASSTENGYALSEVLSTDEEEILVKVAGVELDWLVTQEWAADVEKCIWNYPQGHTEGDAVRLAWKDANVE